MSKKYVELSALKAKLNYIFRAYGVSPQMKKKYIDSIDSLPYTVEAKLETTLDTTEKWINCEERLPDNSDYCLVIYSDYDIYTNDYSGKKRCMVLDYMPQYGIWNIKAPIKVYYWMPLPEFPNEDKEQDK